ncbi:L-arabinose transport system permease protein AraQ [Streptomyces sp. YIM 130001]|uniref:carbohydrate ABC transporter permease n=1 Tax=Streptomyces sp. YIM 130001 TaxID=2259644 RepID=UPI000E651930|nr:carbohydrate ABC transporter permease [Streptomyces sp. YIM 130001]RII13038.1 L-arabinose transport system permease protein AraQ [Streptomyces sp. YIM 130001]
MIDTTEHSARTERPPRPKQRRPRNLDAPSMPVRALKGVVLVVICALVIIPFFGIVSTSIATPDQVTDAGGFVLWPEGFDTTAYSTIFAGGVVTQAILVSVGITFVGTLVSLVGSTMLAYSLSRPGAFGQKPILMLVLVTLLIAPGLIPNYLVVKEFGLLDSYWALIIPTAINGFNIIVLRAFFMGIPQELIDSARIDGAGEFGIFWRVVLPLSRAVLAVIGLFYAVGYWNAFFNALLYISDTAKWPLQLVLRTYVVKNTELGGADLGTSADQLPPQASIQMAILVISIVPILIAYPFLQRHFAKGMLTGAVKG